MFTWICPKCGAEVPPSYAECPNCLGKGPAPAAAERPAAPPLAAAPRATAAARPGPPGWVLAVLFALAFVVALAGAFFAYQKLQARAAATRPAAVPDRPSLPSNEAVKAHPISQYIEVTALRLSEDAKQKAFIQFVVVNHSPAEIGDLAANVRLRAITAQGEQQPVGTFSFKIPLLTAYESKELRAPVDTKLRVYELPDWQFLRADFQITSP